MDLQPRESANTRHHFFFFLSFSFLARKQAADAGVTGEGRHDRWLVSHCIGRREVMLHVCPRTATPAPHTAAPVIYTQAQGAGDALQTHNHWQQCVCVCVSVVL